MSMTGDSLYYCFGCCFLKSWTRICGNIKQEPMKGHPTSSPINADATLPNIDIHIIFIKLRLRGSFGSSTCSPFPLKLGNLHSSLVVLVLTCLPLVLLSLAFPREVVIFDSTFVELRKEMRAVVSPCQRNAMPRELGL